MLITKSKHAKKENDICYSFAIFIKFKLIERFKKFKQYIPPLFLFNLNEDSVTTALLLDFKLDRLIKDFVTHRVKSLAFFAIVLLNNCSFG